MSFLSELKKQKDKLKLTETVVTKADGKRFVECKADGGGTYNTTVCAPSAYGFVVDTKPDDIPVEIIEHLYIGSQDCTAENILEKYAIKRVLSLGIDVDTKEINHKYVPCLDLPETAIKPILSESLSFIHEAIDSKENVLVHCNAGVSRTSLVAIAYLMQYESMEYKQAYDFIKRKRPAIQPNAGFKQQLSRLTPGSVI